MDVEHVFKALADHHRRHLIDMLAQKDGQTLTELCAHLPMSRIGVMKHLRILEEAGLIRTRKVGRNKLHYLNPAPLQSVADWADQYRRFREESYDRLEDILRQQSPDQEPADRDSSKEK